MKIYYAHHLWKYDTPIEEYEIALIKKYFPDAEIINPNGDLGYTEEQVLSKKISESDVMNICTTAVRECDALVFSSMNGVIGKGVCDEIKKAGQSELRIFYLHHNKMIPYADTYIEVIGESNRLFATVHVYRKRK